MKSTLICLFFFVCKFSVNYGEISNTQQNMQLPTETNYLKMGEKGGHSFGVELRENSQFHHTKTDKDGVRMGCYGHVENGKLYTTYYVADAKGYRMVPRQDYITVYPDRNTERKASFVQDFDVEEGFSEIIRHIFPVGCQNPEDLVPEPSQQVPLISCGDSILTIPQTNDNLKCCTCDNVPTIAIPVPVEKLTQDNIISAAYTESEQFFEKVVKVCTEH